jgi:16S rRNA (cytosine967-C5)-methyltransferase
MRRLLPAPVPDGLRLLVVRLDAARPLPFAVKFDRVLLDAPCSGTGTLSRNPEIKWRLEPGDLSRLAAIQAEMLRNALGVLAPGGRLVYATCSLEPEENEQVVEGVLAEKEGPRLFSRDELADEFPHLSPLFDPRGYFRTRPDLHSMDGFFAAVMVREA